MHTQLNRILLGAVFFLCTQPVLITHAQDIESGSEHTLVAVGDIMLAGSSAKFYEEHGYSHAFGDPGLARIIKHADVAFANLEYPVASQGTRHKEKEYTFLGSPSSLDAIATAGFDLLSLANNHTLDYGNAALLSTLRHCQSRGLVCAGAGSSLQAARQLRLVQRRGMRFGLLAYSFTFPKEFWATADKPGVAGGVWKYLEEDIPAARRKVDILIVSFHWGEELKDTPKEYQISVAHRAVQLGASLILGHHPHIPQGIEMYRGAPIFYSLGNFAFGSYSQKAAQGFVARVHFYGTQAARVDLFPVNINNTQVMFQPRSLRGAPARAMVADLNRLSQPFGTLIGSTGVKGMLAMRPSVAPSSRLAVQNRVNRLPSGKPADMPGDTFREKLRRFFSR